MNPDRIRIWVDEKKDHQVATNYISAVASLVFGVVVLFLTFWITYFVIYVAADGLSALCDLLTGQRFYIRHEARLVLSGVFVLLLFLQCFRTKPEYWREYPTDEKDFGNLLKETLGDYKVLSPILSHPKTISKAAADVLLTGPRLTLGSWEKVRQVQKLKQIDTSACAKVLSLVYSRPDAVPYEELRSLGFGRNLPELKTFDGVYFLEAGLLLSDELRTELTHLSLT